MVRERKTSGPNKPPTDFKKRKAKVGKRAVAALSATSTKFSSKRIAMPDQSVLRDRTTTTTGEGHAAPTADQGRELATLLAQHTHYSSHVRSEARLGLAQLCTRHRTLVMDQSEPRNEPMVVGLAHPQLSRSTLTDALDFLA